MTTVRRKEDTYEVFQFDPAADLPDWLSTNAHKVLQVAMPNGQTGYASVNDYVLHDPTSGDIVICNSDTYGSDWEVVEP